MGPHMGFSREISQAAGQEMWPPKASNPSGKSNARELQTKSDLMDKLSRELGLHTRCLLAFVGRDGVVIQRNWVVKKNNLHSER